MDSSPASRWVMRYRAIGPSVTAEQIRGERVGGRRIEVLGGLIEDQDREVGQQRAGYADALALPTGQPRAPSAHLGGQPARQAVEPAGQTDPLEDLAQLVVGRVAVRRRAGSRRWWCRTGTRPGSTRPTTVRTLVAGQLLDGTCR